VYEDAAVGLMLSGDFRVGLSGRQAKENEAVIQTAGQSAVEAAGRVKGKPWPVGLQLRGRRSKLKTLPRNWPRSRRPIGKELPLFGCYCAGEWARSTRPTSWPRFVRGSGWHIMSR